MHKHMHRHTNTQTFIQTYLHTYILTYLITYIHTYILTYINTYIHTVHTCIYVYTYIHAYTQTRLLDASIQAIAHTRTEGIHWPRQHQNLCSTLKPLNSKPQLQTLNAKPVTLNT